MLVLIAGDSLALPRPFNIKQFNPLTEKEMAVSFLDTYGCMIHRKLEKRYPANDVYVVNRSQRAFTMKHVLNQFPDHLYFYQPDIIVLHVGLVDCWFREELNGRQYLPLHEFETCYNSVLGHLRHRPEVKMIVVGICPTSPKMEQRYPGLLKEMSKYNQVLQAKADNKQVFFIAMENLVSAKKTQQYLLPDDQHLNKKGQSLIANEISKIIEAFILNENGAVAFNKSNVEEACKMFEDSFHLYPKYVDNIYNLLGLAYQLNRLEIAFQLIDLIEREKMFDPNIVEMAGFIKSQVKPSSVNFS